MNRLSVALFTLFVATAAMSVAFADPEPDKPCIDVNCDVTQNVNGNCNVNPNYPYADDIYCECEIPGGATRYSCQGHFNL